MNTKISARAVARLFEHMTRAIHSRSFAHGLNPAQWNALRFLSEANPSARTVTAFARHHLTSRSAASDTISALIAKGLLTKRPDPEDARVQLLAVTDAGNRLLENDPMEPVARALENLSDEETAAIAGALNTIVRGIFSDNGNENGETGAAITPMRQRG